jgi:hypothetical protein
LCEHEQVRAYERALGGEPPRAAQRKSQSELTRYLAQRLTLQRTNIELKRIHEQRIKRKLARPALRKFEPRVITGSNFAFHAPPYDVAYTFNPSGNAADANPSTGTYDLACQSFGDGNQQVAAGVASWFFCTEAAVDQRFAALIDFSYDWFDYATAYVAHNDLRTRIWIWGATENDWALQADVQPSWSDGESFYNHNGDSNQGSLSIEQFFAVRQASLYLVWVYSDAQADADSGFFGRQDHRSNSARPCH